MKKRLHIFPFLLAVLLLGCGGGTGRMLDENILLAGQKLSGLKAALDGERLRNAVLIKQYAQIIEQEKPDLAPIARRLATDATANGQPYQYLVGRLEDVKKLKGQFGDPNKLLGETNSIIAAADSNNFNNSLADSVNVLADLSGGKLARVGAIAKDQESAFNDARDYGAGSQLIGNPAYGHWSSRGGTSFWEWYGMYAMFSNVFGGGRRIYYSDWDRHRPYSYYQDYAADHYGSPIVRDKWGSRYGSNYQKSSGARGGSGLFGDRARKTSSFSRGAGVSRKPSGFSARGATGGGSGTGTLRRGSRYSSRGFFRGK